MADEAKKTASTEPTAKVETPAPQTSAPTAAKQPEPEPKGPDADADEGPAKSPELLEKEALVREWISRHLAGGHIARATECWNELQGAVPALALMIKGD